MDRFLQKFRRVTSQGNYFPEIDGLRFLAIFLVVIFHINSFYVVKARPAIQHDYDNYLNTILLTWDKGVQLFFVISGYILALPFATSALKGGKKVNLKSFYLRRLTRLEPPYMLATLIMFSLLIIQGKYSFSTLLPSLLASLTYTHNIIFGPPLILVVTWSLEVEIQYYLVAPFINKVFFLNKILRRSLLAGAILLMALLQAYIHFNIVTIYNFFQYFLMGLLLADLYVSGEPFINLKNTWVNILFGSILLVIILSVNVHSDLAYHLVFLSAIFLFYQLVIFNQFWKKLFSTPVFAIIGGMCYTMYLWHYAIISFFGNYLQKFIYGYNYGTGLSIFIIFLSLPILVFSSLYFYYVEKPCMAKNWHKAFYSKIFIFFHDRDGRSKA